MTQEELNEVLKQHQLWLDSNGVEGKRLELRNVDLTGVDLRDADLSYADLRGADLRGADLKCADLIGANLTDTGIYIFEGPTHQCTYNSKDDKLYVGCQVHNLEHWLNNYVDIGEKHDYSSKVIEIYGNWFKSLKELS